MDVKRLLLPVLLLLNLWVSAQVTLSPSVWKSLDTLVYNKKFLVDARDRVLELKQDAIQSNDPVGIARAFYYEMRIKDQLSEDSLFFKNALYMDSILNSGGSSPTLKSIIHLLKAKRLHHFASNMFHRNNKNLISSYNNFYDFKSMSREKLDSLTSFHFDAALQMSRQLNNIPIEQLLWLSNDPLVFLFKPVFTDIVFAEYISAFYIGTLHNIDRHIEWLTLSPGEFVHQATTNNDIPDNYQYVFRLYSQWMQFQEKNPQAYFYIESLFRKYFYGAFTSDTDAEKKYEQYLQGIIHSPYDAVRANGVYQLCLLWNKLALNYNPGTGLIGYRYNSGTFDTTYRLHFIKALELFNQHEQLLDSFPYLKSVLVLMKEKITRPALNILAEDHYLPGRPMLVYISYKNVKQVFTRFVKLDPFEGVFTDSHEAISYYLKLPSFVEKKLPIPGAEDYQKHNSFLKQDALPAGRYIMLYSDSAFSNDPSGVDFAGISVTNIAVINNDNRVFVLDRKTGFPITGAKTIVRYRDPVTSTSNTEILASGEPRLVNDQGFITVTENSARRIRVYYNGDSVESPLNAGGDNLPDNIYDKDEYDDLTEYYEEHTHLEIFTDRAIYRPGQTVHYKGIFFTTNPRTGENVILNWKNLQFPFFKKIFYKVALKLSGQKITLYIKDPFNRKADTIKAIPNKYGSIAGSFVIPKDAATGEWEFHAEDIDISSSGYGGRTFKVEEYKRPSFELVLEKPKNELYLGDSFAVRIQAKTFAGAQLENVQVNYSITRNIEVPAENDSLKTKYWNDTIISGKGYTNGKGEIVLNVHDRLLQAKKFPDNREWHANYEIDAEAIDATGESHDQNTSIKLSSRPVMIRIPVNNVMERNEIAEVYISAQSAFAGPVKKLVNVYIWKEPELSHKRRNPWPQADTWIHSKNELQQWFEDIDFDFVDESVKNDKLVYSTSMQAGGDSALTLPKDILQSGSYRIEVVCRESGHITGIAEKQFEVFDKIAGTLPQNSFAFNHLPFNLVKKGGSFTWYTGNTEKDVFSIYHILWMSKNKKGITEKVEYDIRPEKKGVNEWKYTIPSSATGKLALTHLYIFDNTLYSQREDITIEEDQKQNIGIVVEQYRKKLTPGSKETFTVSIKTKNENVAAELMTTMYDGTLDRLEMHRWEAPRFRDNFSLWPHWNQSITVQSYARLFNNLDQYVYVNRYRGKALWWLNPADYEYIGPASFFQEGDNTAYAYNALEGRTAGLTVLNAKGLDEVVVVGYGTVKRAMYSTSNVVMIRGTASLGDYKKYLIILDGVPYEGDINKIPTENINGITLMGADAVALYGSRAENGVLILSTKGPVQLPVEKQMPSAPVIRRNFEESAFFYPQIHARGGYYSFDFTLPESVTSWKWKMLAHTKKAAFAYDERTILSQLPLMVQPDMPRFLYQGDKIILKSRITNMDSSELSGSLTCTIEDMETGEDISSRLLNSIKQDFKVKQVSNSNGSFELTIPKDMLHPLRIKIAAATNTFSDGEEHIIPVLSNRILATKTILAFSDSGTDHKMVTSPTLTPDETPYGIGVFVSPMARAAMINSLPFLANYPYNCAEQTFNKLLANAIMIRIMATDSNARQSLESRKPESKEAAAGNSQPDDISERTMPWLQLHHATALQHERLVKLADTFNARRQISKYLEELISMQNTDGGITWFKGGNSNPYISTYLLAGFGRLNKENIRLSSINEIDYKLNMFINKLIDYCDAQFSNPKYYQSSIHYLYGRSFWSKKYPPTGLITEKIDSLLNLSWKFSDKLTIGEQSLLIITTLRYTPAGSALQQQALLQLESIRQQAINDNAYGTRWKIISDADDLSMQTEEWVIKIAEAFEEAGKSPETVDGIIRWLLNARSEHNWSTTKTTADAVTLLNRHHSSKTGAPVEATAKGANFSMKVSNNLFSGQLFAFSRQTGGQFDGTVSINKDNPQPATIGINYYYFTASPPGNNNVTGVRISKALYRYNPTSAKWDSIAANTSLAVADKIKTILTIEAPRQLQYVFIEDKHAAALEPADISSGYQYELEWHYYKSIRDASMQFFAEKIPSGIHTISYETVVSKTGNFYNGPAQIQCMYRPEVKAYAAGISLTIK